MKHARVLRALCRGVAALLLLASLEAAAYTEAQDFFMKGVRAHDEGSYAEAVSLLAEAARRDGKEALASFKYKGLNTEDYLPHFYLGRSYEKLGKTAEALEEFRESERQGAIRGRAALSTILKTSIAKLEASLPKPAATAMPAVEARPTPLPPSPTPVAAALPSPSPVPVALLPTATPVPREDYVKPEVPDGARADVEKGMRAFFQAEYDEAVKILEPLSPRIPLARAFLAYSRAAAWLLKGGDESALTQARSDYRQVRKFVRAESERRWVSPAILRVLSAGDADQRKR